MNFFQICNWETNLCQIVAVPVFTHKIYVTMHGKLSTTQFDVSLFSNPVEKVWQARNTMGMICPTLFLHFMTFSQQLETNYALQCSSDSFPRMVIYILFVENCQNYILTHSCLPIAGRMFYYVRFFRDPGSESATEAICFVLPCVYPFPPLTCPVLISRHGQSQGLLFKHLSF